MRFTGPVAQITQDIEEVGSAFLNDFRLGMPPAQMVRELLVQLNKDEIFFPHAMRDQPLCEDARTGA